MRIYVPLGLVPFRSSISSWKVNLLLRAESTSEANFSYESVLFCYMRARARVVTMWGEIEHETMRALTTATTTRREGIVIIKHSSGTHTHTCSHKCGWKALFVSLYMYVCVWEWLLLQRWFKQQGSSNLRMCGLIRTHTEAHVFCFVDIPRQEAVRLADDITNGTFKYAYICMASHVWAVCNRSASPSEEIRSRCCFVYSLANKLV